MEEATLKALQGCDLSIHLVGQRYGMIPEESDNSMAELQNPSAASFDKEGFQRLIGCPRDATLRTRSKKLLLAALLKARMRTAVQRSSLTRSKTSRELVVEKLTPKPESPKEDASKRGEASVAESVE